MNSQKIWPDKLEAASPSKTEDLLCEFWRTLDSFADLVPNREFLLLDEATGKLRMIVVELMLNLNGIQRPSSTLHLNSYLGESQLAALEKTLHLPLVDASARVGQAVSLVVIYRWYAPQLVEKYGLDYPHALETAVWERLCRQIPTWPSMVTTSE